MRHQRLSNLILSAAVLAFAVLPAHADGPITEPTHIFATDWGLTLKGDGTGFYNDLAQLIFSPDIGRSTMKSCPTGAPNGTFSRRQAPASIQAQWSI